MEKLNLKNITAICLEGRDINWHSKEGKKDTTEKCYESFVNRIKITLTYLKTFFDFKEIVFISPFDPKIDTIKYIHTKPISFNDYNIWCIKNLDDYFDSDFCFLFQDDGFPLNPEFWDNEFLTYDYVGAPVKLGQLDYIGEEQIGGGGFTLRSKKFTKYIKNKQCDGVTYEDKFCVTTLIKEKNTSGLKLAPHTIARKFVIQNPLDQDHTIDTSFGFHGSFGDRLSIIEKTMLERLNGVGIYL